MCAACIIVKTHRQALVGVSRCAGGRQREGDTSVSKRAYFSQTQAGSPTEQELSAQRDWIRQRPSALNSRRKWMGKIFEAKSSGRRSLFIADCAFVIVEKRDSGNDKCAISDEQ
jgi:hypothetical protein